ncbi:MULTISPECIES: hypothetical protein [Metabacillus]|uniref:hypothetical protein n=1 Tax=Metabacillus TaxID=2675233 RepID=UPI000C80DAEC|nr:MULTISPECIES: hypothetical protein [Metabacillus]MCM3443974.1 hypothetical protein [Metabacillus halosaccharovorans]PMC34971.1 hypothetical protein CJ195_20915 [Bacillus sp. UMB0899]
MRKLHISEMEEGKIYIIKSYGSSEYSLVKKQEEEIEVIYCGGEFNQPQTVKFKIEVIHLIEGYESLTLEELTIDMLDEVSVSIYNIYMSNNVSSDLSGKISVI